MASFHHKIRNRFFSPDSKLELFFRTIYHRVNSSKAAFLIKDLQAKNSFRVFRKTLEMHGDAAVGETRTIPKVSFLIEVNQGTEDDVAFTIHSLLALDLKQWQLIIFASDKAVKEDLISLMGHEERLFFADIEMFELSDCPGDFLVFCQPGDYFFPRLLTEFYRSLAEYPEKDCYFYDCEYLSDLQCKPEPLVKPARVTMDPLLSVNLLGGGFFRREFALKVFNKIKTFSNLQACEYDLALSVSSFPDGICHIPEILLRQKRLLQPDQPGMPEIAMRHLESVGLEDVTFEQKLGQPHFQWRIYPTRVTIIVPTRNHHRLLKNLLSSLETTTFKDFEIFLVDNGSTDTETLAFYDQIIERQDVSIIHYDEPFNYSRAINLGASRAKTDLLLFLNDDMQVIHPGWLGELVQWAQRPEIGVVGTKLIRRNQTIQHAGIVAGVNEFVGHIYLNAPEHYHGLFGPVDWYRNFLALTGACQMVRRSVYEEVNGYDEDFRLAFGDIDFCLRVQSLGYRNVYSPFAYLYHFEGQARGYSTPIDDILHGYRKLQNYLMTPDPYYSERLSLTTIPKYLPNPLDPEERESRIEERRKFYLK